MPSGGRSPAIAGRGAGRADYPPTIHRPARRPSSRELVPAPRYMFFDALASVIRGVMSTIVAASSMTPDPAPKYPP